MFVFDFGDADGGLNVPDEMDLDFFDISYRAGSRIHSDSWGSNSEGHYTLTDYEFDDVC